MDKGSAASSDHTSAASLMPEHDLDWSVLLSLDEENREKRDIGWSEMHTIFTPDIKPLIGYLVGGQPSEIEEVTAETWRKTYFYVHRQEQLKNPRPTNFLALLKSSATSVAFDYLRKRGRDEKRRAALEQQSHEERTDYLCELISEETFQSEELRSRFGDRLSLLDDKDRAVLTAYAEGYGHEEIANLLGITAAASRKRLQRIREVLNPNNDHA